MKKQILWIERQKMVYLMAVRAENVLGDGAENIRPLKKQKLWFEREKNWFIECKLVVTLEIG